MAASEADDMLNKRLQDHEQILMFQRTVVSWTIIQAHGHNSIALSLHVLRLKSTSTVRVVEEEPATWFMSLLVYFSDAQRFRIRDN